MRAASGSGAFARFNSAVTTGLTVVLAAVPGAPCGSGGASMGVNTIDSVRVRVEFIIGQDLPLQRTSNAPGFVLRSPLFSRSE
jgi:hypothetical protein